MPVFAAGLEHFRSAAAAVRAGDDHGSAQEPAERQHARAPRRRHVLALALWAFGEETNWKSNDCCFSRYGYNCLQIGYGAGYYSYLYARVFASNIWDACFQQNPLDAAAGKRLHREMLVHGGAKDPHDMLRSLIGRDPSMESYLHEIGV